MDNQRIGLKIAQLRMQKNYSTTELARRTGLSQPQISRLENGHQGFRSSTLARISEALEVTPGYFFDNEVEAVGAVRTQQREKRGESGAALEEELRAGYGTLASLPGWSPLIRRMAAVVSRESCDVRTLRRLVDRILSMNNDDRSRLLKRLTGR